MTPVQAACTALCIGAMGWTADVTSANRSRQRDNGDDTLITMRSRDKSGFVLAPTRYHRAGDILQPSPVVTMALHLVGLSHIDANDASFEVELYLSLTSPDASLGIDSFEFTNAAGSPASEERLVLWHEIHGGAAGTSLPAGVKLYQGLG